MSCYNLGVRGCSPTKLWHLTQLLVRVLNQVRNSRTPPLKIWEKKNGRRANSRWALPQIFSVVYVLTQKKHKQHYFTREISEMRGPTGVKFCTLVSTKPNFIMPVQNFEEHTGKKFQGRKTCKIWPDFKRLRS